MNVKQNLEEYIKHKFCVPCYQRGYKWGVEKKDGTTDASILVSDIIDAFHNSKEEYFIQGVTAYFKDKELYLIDRLSQSLISLYSYFTHLIINVPISTEIRN